jgi:hypothetical protein
MTDARGLVQTTLTQLRASGIDTREECTAALCAKLHSSITNPEQLKTLATEAIEAEFGCHHTDDAPASDEVVAEGGANEEVVTETVVAGVGVVDEASTEAVVEAAAENVVADTDALVEAATEVVTDETVAEKVVSEMDMAESVAVAAESVVVATEGVPEEGAVAASAVAVENEMTTEAATEVAVDAAPVDMAVEAAQEVMPSDIDLVNAKLDALIDAHSTMQARMDQLSFLVESTIPQSATTATRKQLALYSESFLFPEQRSNHEKYRAAINAPTDIRAAVNKFLLERRGVRDTTTSPTSVSDDTIA